MGCLQPGALIAQNNNVLAQYVYSKGPRGFRPVSPPRWSIYAIVNLRNGRAYVGRTIRSPFLRFQEHAMDDASHFRCSLRDNPNGFVVLQLEKVSGGTVLQEYRKRESSGNSRLDNLHSGYNSGREIAKPPALLVPTHGYGPAPITRSRHPDHIKMPNLQARYLANKDRFKGPKVFFF